MKTFQDKKKRYRCLTCRALMDGATPLNADVAPSPGDLSICAYCGTAQQFGRECMEALDVSKLEEGDRQAIEAAQRLAAEMRRRLGREKAQ